MKLLFRADDLGYSEGVNFGIAKAVQGGLIGGVGVMANMPAAEHGLALLDLSRVCLGQHTNICVGRPLIDPAKIPSITTPDGRLKPSSAYRSATEDFVVLEEVVLEIEAQYRRFVALTGRQPDYFEGHAVSSVNFFKGLELVAEKHGLKYSGLPAPGQDTMQVGQTPVRMVMESMQPDYDPYAMVQRVLEQGKAEECCLLVFHPGYLDGTLLRTSSLTSPRAHEVDMLVDPVIKDMLKRANAEFITYLDL